jgi:hypothetical protein
MYHPTTPKGFVTWCYQADTISWWNYNKHYNYSSAITWRKTIFTKIPPVHGNNNAGKIKGELKWPIKMTRTKKQENHQRTSKNKENNGNAAPSDPG